MKKTEICNGNCVSMYDSIHPPTQSKEVVVMTEGFASSSPQARHCPQEGKCSPAWCMDPNFTAPHRLTRGSEETAGDQMPGRRHGELLDGKARLQGSILPFWKGTLLLQSKRFVLNASLSSSVCP